MAKNGMKYLTIPSAQQAQNGSCHANYQSI